MGVQPALFQAGGQAAQVFKPGGYTFLDFVKSTGGLVASANGVIMGDCRGGQPNTVMWFTSPTDAAAVLRSGTLLDAIRHAFIPGGGVTPQAVGALRVNPGTQATRSHQYSAAAMLDVSTWDWGLHTNMLQSKLEAGTTGSKLTISFQPSVNAPVVYDNILRNSFSIHYTGTAAASVMSISLTQLTTVNTAGVDNITAPFANYATVTDLVNYLNATGKYTATVLDPNPLRASAQLDSVTSADIQGATVTATSNLQAIIDTYNSNAWVGMPGGAPGATWHAAATSRNVPTYDTVLVNFSGAIDGNYTVTEWGVSLAYMQSQNVQFVSASTGDAAVHALVKAHCEAMCAVSGKQERQFIVGGVNGETTAQVAARSAAVASQYGMLVAPGFKWYDFNDPTGQTIKTYEPIYLAAKALGLMVSQSINEPITWKTVSTLGWERVISSADRDALIQAGVCCGVVDQGGRFIFERGVTTFGGSVLQQCEFSMMREALYVARDLRTAVENAMIGHAGTLAALDNVDSIVATKLAQYLDMGLFTGTPPYWGYTKSILGDQVRIQYSCYLTAPINFAFLTSHMNVYASLNS